MKILAALMLMLFFPLFVYSSMLTCEIKINDSSKFMGKINSLLGEKTLVAKTPEIISYLTQKNDSFVIEGFLTNYDARIYAEGSLKNSGDKLTASLWGRDILIDVSCAN